MAAPIKKVGFAGLGLMGSRMARRLAQRGFELALWNRTAPVAQALAAELGAQVASSPADLAARSEAVLTCLSDPAAVRAVALGAEGLFSGSREGQLLVDFSTSLPELAQELAAEAGRRGMQFLDVPVTGSKAGAASGTLLLIAGGAPEALERARPVLDALGDKLVHCGPVGSASQVKLGLNALTGMMLEGLCEALLLTQTAGADPRKLLEVVQLSRIGNPYFQLRGNSVLARDFQVNFELGLMRKDLSLFLESAARHGVPAPTVAAVRGVYEAACARGLAEEDVSTVVRVLEDGRTAGRT